MKTKGTVIAVKGKSALVECIRGSACDGCHKMSSDAGCGICSLMGAGKSMRVLANNVVGSEVGDVVMVENANGRVLLDAALVFLFPIVGMLTGYFATGAFPVAEEIRYIAAGIGFLLPMIGIVIYSSWKSRRQTTLSVTEILSRPTEGQESS